MHCALGVMVSEPDHAVREKCSSHLCGTYSSNFPPLRNFASSRSACLEDELENNRIERRVNINRTRDLH